MRSLLPSPVARVALLAAVALLGYGLWIGRWPRTLDAAVVELTDGDADRAERLHCLAVVREQGLVAARAGDARAALLAAMASLALEDRPTADAALALLDAKARLAEDAWLGEPYLRPLLQGIAAEREGDPAQAARGYRQAEVSASLIHAETARAFAAAALARVR